MKSIKLLVIATALLSSSMTTSLAAVPAGLSKGLIKTGRLTASVDRNDIVTCQGKAQLKPYGATKYFDALIAWKEKRDYKYEIVFDQCDRDANSEGVYVGAYAGHTMWITTLTVTKTVASYPSFGKYRTIPQSLSMHFLNTVVKLLYSIIRYILFGLQQRKKRCAWRSVWQCLASA